MAWIRMSGGGSKPKITNVLEYLKQINGWSRTDGGSTSDLSGVSITYGTTTRMQGAFRNNAYSNFDTVELDVKNASKLIASYNFTSSVTGMNGTFVVKNVATGTTIYSSNKQSFTDKEIDITYVDKISITVGLGSPNVNYFTDTSMVVSKLMLE